MSRIETAIGGRRFTREQLKTVEAYCAHRLGEYLDSPMAADVAPGSRVAAKRDIDRAIRADVALATGSAAGLAPAYRDEIAEWNERLHRFLLDFIKMALASEGLADWCSGERFWAFPGEGDRTAESEFQTERREQLAIERIREWFRDSEEPELREGIGQMFAKAEAAAELTEQKRRECKWGGPLPLTLAEWIQQARQEPDEDE